MGKPARSNKLVHGFLLMKIESEERSANFLESLYVSTVLKVPPHALQLERSAGGESHYAESSGEETLEEEEVGFSTLDYYAASEIPGTLAVVRYTIDVDEFGGISVSERAYPDRPEGWCDLEQDVVEALSIGIDVAILSHVDPELLPEINQFLTDVGTEV